mmetsp:Transcript_62592/g.137062  ORF Transcript_62592/g.137062 Transcript_62592/m.137062 type:complete len:211 (+) Transcript_62592:888-1520(+)
MRMKAYDDKWPSFAPHSCASFAHSFTAIPNSAIKGSNCAYAWSKREFFNAFSLFTETSTSRPPYSNFSMGTRAVRMTFLISKSGLSKRIFLSFIKTSLLSSVDSDSGVLALKMTTSKSQPFVPNPVLMLPKSFAKQCRSGSRSSLMIAFKAWMNFSAWFSSSLDTMQSLALVAFRSLASAANTCELSTTPLFCSMKFGARKGAGGKLMSA